MGSTELQGILQQLTGTTLDAQGCLQLLGANDFDWNGALAAIVPDQPSIVQNWTDLTPLLVNDFTAGATTPEYRVMRSNRAETLDQRYYECRGLMVLPDPLPTTITTCIAGLPFNWAFRHWLRLNEAAKSGFNVVGRRYNVLLDDFNVRWSNTGAELANEENDLRWITGWIEDEA